MKVNNVKNPKWANPNHSVIECDVDFDELDENYVSFGAMESGDVAHTHEIFSRCIAGEFGLIAEYVSPIDITGEAALNQVRSKRNYILATEIDPIVSNPLRWEKMTSAQKQAWSNYRRFLLDITTSYPNPSFVWNEDKQGYDEVGVVWPVKP